MTSEILKVFAAFINFIYLAQLEPLTDQILGLMDENLALFHSNKHVLSEVGLRDGTRMKGDFKIPKLEMLHHVCRFARAVGSLEQFSADQTERLHIEMAKEPYRSTNKKDFGEQMCRARDRKEKVRLFSMFLEWKEVGTSALSEKFLPPLVRNSFLDECVPQNETTAFLITERISLSGIGIRAASSFYHLPQFTTVLSNYYRKQYRGQYMGVHHRLPFKLLDTWQHVRLQLRSAMDPGIVRRPVALMAAPPSKGFPHGYCNFALVKMPPDSSVLGIKGRGSETRVSALLFMVHFMLHF